MRRPPNLDRVVEPQRLELQRCIHCGLCLQACPTFIELGKEEESPRGRLYLMRAVVEGHLKWAQVVSHLDLCLGCLGCQTACPSGVPYAHLIEAARSQVEQKARRPFQRWVRHQLLATLTRPHRMRYLLLITTLLRVERIPRLITQLAGIEGNEVKLPKLPKVRWNPQQVYPAQGELKCRAGLLTGCVMQLLFPQVYHATVAVLCRNGVEVHVPPDQACCGALWLHNGYPRQAARLARRQLQAFREVDFVVVNAAGCGATLKEYPRLLENTPLYEKAQRFAKRVRDLNELLAEIGFQPPEAELKWRVTYHDACHLAHGQGIREQPRWLLSKIKGLTLLEMEEADLCCGSAGIYNLLQPHMARRLLTRKVHHILAQEPDAVVSANPGCNLWIAQGLQDAGKPIPIYHPVELLAFAYKATPPV